MRVSHRSSGSSRLLLSIALLLGCTEVTPSPQTAAPALSASASAQASASASSSAEPFFYDCIVHGTVTSDKGAPVPGALVAAVPAGTGDPAAVAKADARGRYCIPSLEAGAFGFTVTSPDLTAQYLDVQDIAPAAMKMRSLDFHLGGPGHTLSGLVVDDKGAPLPSTRIHISRFSNFMADLFVTQTGDDGRYRVMLPEADYSAAVQSDTFVSPRTPASLKKDQTVNLTAQRLNPKATPAPDEVVAWVKSNAIPLVSPEAGKGFDDMAPLAAIVGDAKMVALGEATHGTREFFQLKHRMLEFLVEKKGFRSFGIEASFGDCLPLTEYVRTGKGDPAAALANQGFWTWDTEEVLALVTWMRAYNEDKAHKEKLTFWGFDMQSPAASAQALLTFFAKADPAFAKEIGAPLEPLDDDFTAGHLDGLPKPEVTAAVAIAKTIAERLDTKKDEYIKKTIERDVALAKIHARILGDYLATMIGEDGSRRDRSMADTVEALFAVENLPPKSSGASAPKSSPPRKMVVWAHNGHVNKRDNGGPPSMGSYLAKRFADEYKVFGFAFDEGGFRASDVGIQNRGLIPFTVPPAPPGSLDHTFGRTGIPLFALDLHAAPPGPVADWLGRASFTRWVGSAFDENQPGYGIEPVLFPSLFDALFFVQKTTAARGTKTGQWSPRKGAAPDRTVPDPGFETTKAGESPTGWSVTSMPRQLQHRVVVTDKGCAAGKHCLTLERTKGDVSTGLGTASFGVEAKSWAGRVVLITATARVEGKGVGDEAFFFAFSREDAVRWTRVSGASWKKVEFEFRVPEDTESLRIGIAATGAAKAGLDDVLVQVLPN